MSTNKNILNAKNVRKNPVLAPISAALRPWIKERWDVIRFVEEPVIVNGKQRFYRFELRRRKGVEI